MRRSPLIARPPADRSREPGYKAWHAPAWGACAACGAPGPLERHHVLTAQTVRREGGDVWDLRNALALGRCCGCHRDHHGAARRLPVSVITAEHLAFMIELLGEDRAALYVARFYRVA